MIRRSSKKELKYKTSVPNSLPGIEKQINIARRTLLSRMSINSQSERVLHNKSRQYKLTDEDLEFVRLYSKHFPRAEHRVRPTPNSSRKRKVRTQDEYEGEAEDTQESDPRSVLCTRAQYGKREHTYELAQALCKLKERPVPLGVKGQMRLIGALRKLDQERECEWKCWMQCAMRREAQHINNMRLAPEITRAQNLQDVGPPWYQQLSWEQMELVNKLEMTLYQDIDEGTTSRTRALLQALGVNPPPSSHIVKSVMDDSQDNPCKFLIGLYRVVSTTGHLPGEEDSETEGKSDGRSRQKENNEYRTGFEYSLDERILLSALSHLRVGNVLEKLAEEFGKPSTHLPYFKMVLPPCEKRRKKPLSENTWPYLQPQYMPEYNWLEPKMIQDAIYAQNLYMSLHRVPPPIPPELQPVPFTHIEIPENLKPRRYKSSTAKDKDRTPQDESPPKTSTNPSGSASAEATQKKRHRMLKSTGTSDTDDVSTSLENAYGRTRKNTVHRRHRHCNKPSVVAKPRLRLLSWLRRVGQSTGGFVKEDNLPLTPLPNNQAQRNLKKRTNSKKKKKEQCKECDCKEIARKGKLRVEDSDSPEEEEKPVTELDVAGYIPSIPEEPLAQLSGPHELPAIQKWMRMRNGLTYIHPVLSFKLNKRSKALWRILECGKCSNINSPQICLTREEERRLTWDHHAWLRKECNRLEDAFYRTCFEMQVALAREFYPSMAMDYIPNRDKMLKIYFIYLPAKPQDCFRSPWKKADYNHEIWPSWRRRFEGSNNTRSQD